MTALAQFDPYAPYRGAALLLGRRPNPYVFAGQRRRRSFSRSLTGIGALSPDQAAEQIFPAASVRAGAGHNQAVRDLIARAVSAGQLLDPSGAPGYSQAGDCSATGVSSNVRLAQTASGLALTGVSIGLLASGAVTAAALAPFTMGISAIIGLFPIIFGHHARAVKKEQSVLCAAVPAANNYLQIIDQAVGGGMASPADAQAALDSLVSGFRSQVSGILHGSDPTSSGECNAACVMLSQLRAIVAYKKSVYQDMASPAAAASSPVAAISGAAGSFGIPSWALWLLGGILLYEFAT
ncbi:MAG: hypothetical protein E6H00_13080 [Bacillati bacterium ANGP1]|uniref:Uncharacterized protein n=1 Tax=Candidatus Segetimicrobium genomatis TaxID=2569760 RepID=A0A537JXV1_9BACT|nr:MAG: hypothetical protein E6H00_13080 [Terrabacteria group bacterium ANGP1]